LIGAVCAACLLVCAPQGASAQSQTIALSDALAAFDGRDIKQLEAIATGTLRVEGAYDAADPAGALSFRLSIARRLIELDQGVALRAFEALAGEVRTANVESAAWLASSRPELIEIFSSLSSLETKAGRAEAASKSAGEAYRHAQLLYAEDSEPLLAARETYAAARVAAGLPPLSDTSRRMRGGTRGARSPFNLIEVHYATHRRPTGSKVPAEYFGAEVGPLRYGKAVVSVPTDREIGSLPKPSMWALEFRADPAKHITLTKVSAIGSRDQFLGDVAAKIGRSAHKEAFVFVHGYNSSFEAAVERAAQIAADLHMDGAPIVYSWPSRGSVLGYLTDAEVVGQKQLSADLTNFLRDVAQKTGARRVHLVAHSMGNRLVVRALQQLAAEPNPPHFSEVVFAAPDVGQKDFIAAWPKMRRLGDRFTLYASKRDKALLLSQQVNGEVRAGDANALVVQPGLQSIDTSLASGGLLGHNDFAGSALEDFRAVLWLSLAPEKRCVLQASGARSARYWTFGNGCAESEFREATARVRAAGSPDAALKRLEADMAKAPAKAGALARIRQRIRTTFADK
jgi:esterase/lipase superfamily enzyme